MYDLSKHLGVFHLGEKKYVLGGKNDHRGPRRSYSYPRRISRRISLPTTILGGFFTILGGINTHPHFPRWKFSTSPRCLDRGYDRHPINVMLADHGARSGTLSAEVERATSLPQALLNTSYYFSNTYLYYI